MASTKNDIDRSVVASERIGSVNKSHGLSLLHIIGPETDPRSRWIFSNLGHAGRGFPKFMVSRGGVGELRPISRSEARMLCASFPSPHVADLIAN